MKQKIIIRADGSSSIGMGHIIRCLALAEMLKQTYTIAFAIQKPDDSVLRTILPITNDIIQLPETINFEEDAANFITHLTSNNIVILDGYNFQTEYQKKIKNKDCKLVYIDDLHAWHHVADIVINHAQGIEKSEYAVAPYTQLFLGLNYALLRAPFLKKQNKTKNITAVKKAFISMGAADLNNNTIKYTEALIPIKEVEEIHLMVSSINPNIYAIKQLAENNNNKVYTYFNISAEELALLLNNCDIAICPASSISLECCGIGIGLISGYTAENQLDNLKGLAKQKTLINFEDMNIISQKELTIKFQSLFKQTEKLNILIKNQRKMIDGKSPERLMSIFKNL